MTKTAVVIGGSLAGLIHGIMLRANGYMVTILEQDPSEYRQGLDAGISVSADFTRFMEKYDRTDRDYSIIATHAQILKERGLTKIRLPWEVRLTSWALVWSILRADFDGQASRAVPTPPAPKDVPEVRYQRGARVTGVEDMVDTICVHVEHISGGTTEVIESDLVIAADGSSSSIRKIVLPEVESVYAGYVTWRGTLPEDQLDESFHDVLGHNFTTHRLHGGHIVVYVIPTDDGMLTRGKRLLNWAWYHDLTGGAPSLAESMTDINGQIHQGTVPRELIRPQVWEALKAVGLSKAPASIVQLLERTKSPYITKITEVASPQAVFMGEKLLLVGDALVKFRPHRGLSTNQAAFDCLALEEVIKGRLTMKQWERKVLGYGQRVFLISQVLGNFQQGYKIALFWSILNFLRGLIRLGVGLLPVTSKL